MPSCVVRGCVCTWKKRDPTIILHSFPKEPGKIKLWLQQTGQYGVDIDEMVEKVYQGKVYDTYRMCSLHFTDDSYHYDCYRRFLRKDAVPTIFNTKNQSSDSSISEVATDLSMVSGPLISSTGQYISEESLADSPTPSDSSTVYPNRVEFPVHPQASLQSNSTVSDRSVTDRPTATTMRKSSEILSALSFVSQQLPVLKSSTASSLELPVSSSHAEQLEQLKSANSAQRTSAPVKLLQKASSSIFPNSNLPLKTQHRLEATSSSTQTSSSTTSTCPIRSLSPASTPVISTSGTDKPPYKSLTASPISIPLTVVKEKKPCSTTVLPVSGNMSSVTQTSPVPSSLAQKPSSLSAVRIPLTIPASQTASPSSHPPSKKRKLEENVFLEHSTPSSSNPSVLPSRCTSQTSVNTGKLYFVPGSAPLVHPSSLSQKPLMVDKGVNTDFVTNRRSCCISTDHFYRRRNAQTQTKIQTKHRKIMCNLLLPGKPTKLSKSTVSRGRLERFSDSSSSRSSDSEDDQCEVLETVNLNLVKVEVLSDSEMDISVPSSDNQTIHFKEENESSAGKATLPLKPLRNTGTVPDFDISTLKKEPNIKVEENQFPMSASQNLTLVSQSPKISPIRSEPLVSGCRNPTSGLTSVQTDDEPEDLNDFSFYSNDLSEDEDESFLVPSDAEDEDDIKPVFQDLDLQMENIVEEEKYIVFESCLRKLIMMIPCMSKTKCMSPLTQYRKETIGSHLSIEARCSSGHTSLLWESQPRHGYQPLGNVLLSAAVLFSGSSFLKSQHMFKLLNLKSIDKTTYHKNQYMYLYPAISHHWKEEQKGVIQGAQERPLCLAGDQQLDKPGFSAKYSIYSLMDVTSKKICSFSVEPVNPQVTLDCLEKTGFQKAMDELQTMNVDVKMIVTDRSVAIQEVLNDNYPNIRHRLDLWHLSKSIGNEVLMAAKHKDCEILYHWVETIRNHIWWSSRTCSKNPDLLIQKWKSVIQHVSNVHEWDGDSDCKACPHPPLPEDVVNSTNWLQKDSAAYEQLKKIVENTSLLRDFKQLSSCPMGELEIYHGTCLKYCPKTSYFFMDSMVARAQLAALDHNRNVHTVKAVVQNASSGDDLPTMTQRLEVSKGQKSWTMKALYKPSCQNFLFDIMTDVIALVREEKTF
ncbi:uncharacterized protein [Eleutherodactylus coqui]|uniref:THAP-type domain-containing protein n=1 Tax=Eleutherodactylus coqui TaxID=57060 RepID=A0A8J6K1N3_ELECQ|nr:hypothetical protein GDO78_003766 [Eleutherodactylus coqui]